MLNINTVKAIINSVSFKMVINKDGIGFSASSVNGDDIMLKVFRRSFSDKFNLTMLYDGKLFEGIVSRNAYNIICKVAEAHNREIDLKVLDVKKAMDEANSVIKMACLRSDNKQVIRALEELDLNTLRSNVTKYTTEIGEYEVCRFLEACSYAEGMLHMANRQ